MWNIGLWVIVFRKSVEDDTGLCYPPESYSEYLDVDPAVLQIFRFAKAY